MMNNLGDGGSQKIPEMSSYEEHKVQQSSFYNLRLDSTLYLIVEDDAYGEHPHIYVKTFPDFPSSPLLIVDTGCNTPRLSGTVLPASPGVSLRSYLETYPISSNNNQPLNPAGQKNYIICCTHSHYDHILGIPPFLASTDDIRNTIILASASDPNFILHNLGKHSLCDYMGIETPQYTVSYWARDMEYLSYLPPSASSSSSPLNFIPASTSLRSFPLQMQALHTPGHTPDSLMLYDLCTSNLFVGDLFYARTRTLLIPGLPDTPNEVARISGVSQATIIFPEEGSWIEYLRSLDKLLDFVEHQNAQLIDRWERNSASKTSGEQDDEMEDPSEPKPQRVRVFCGHSTAGDDAEQMIKEVRNFFELIIDGSIPVKSTMVRREIIFDYWEHVDENGRFDVLAPRRLVEEVRGARQARGYS